MRAYRNIFDAPSTPYLDKGLIRKGIGLCVFVRVPIGCRITSTILCFLWLGWSELSHNMWTRFRGAGHQIIVDLPVIFY